MVAGVSERPDRGRQGPTIGHYIIRDMPDYSAGQSHGQAGPA